jgi:hypothetical protein
LRSFYQEKEQRNSGSSLDFCVLFIKKKNKETAAPVLNFWFSYVKMQVCSWLFDIYTAIGS